jgi:hypothetical protein
MDTLGYEAPQSLDELLDLDAHALDQLYRRATVPALTALEGRLRGRMLAWPDAPAPVAAVLRALGRSNRFPWRGKTFTAHGASSGEGANRVFLDRLELFRFSTSIGPSRSGGGAALLIDYDRPQNPFFIRALKDELRELRPGVYLGQGWLVTRSAARLLLYFGLQAR